MKNNSRTILKYVFILGFILDTGVALNWFLIAGGYQLPSILSGYIGGGLDYQFAMYVAGMFMLGWGVILAWGALDPIPRRGLLPITGIFLLLSVLIEFVVYYSSLGGGVFVFGVCKRLVLFVLFTGFYFYSIKLENS